MHFKLYGNRQSGHSYKVALALSLSEVNWDYHTVDLNCPRDQRPEEFRLASRFGEVPVLLIDNTPHCQSNAILLKLCECLPLLHLSTEEARRNVREWLSWESNRIGFSLPNIRFVKKFAAGAMHEVLPWLETRLKNDLQILDKELAHNPFLGSQHWTVADISCAGYLFWADQIDLSLAPYPHLGGWLSRLAALPGWKAPGELI